MNISKVKVEQFRQVVWDFYLSNKRAMPWREPEKTGKYDPYKIMVSEVMLQQTQVSRVIPKYQQFIERFPTISSLAVSPLAEVLKVWSGLGYNRRAKFLWQAVQEIHNNEDNFPSSMQELTALPGIGINTAGAILTYAFDQSYPFIETNVRTVYIHHFFKDRENVSDRELREVVDQTIDMKRPRQWYWALMDYGTYLKQSEGNVAARSKHYMKQTLFKGSVREIRGAVIRHLTTAPKTTSELSKVIPDDRLDTILESLQREELICRKKDTFSLC